MPEDTYMYLQEMVCIISVKTFYISTDSVVNIQPHLTDVEHTFGKAYVSTSVQGYWGDLENFVAVYQTIGTIGINDPVVSVPKDYVFYTKTIQTRSIQREKDKALKFHLLCHSRMFHRESSSSKSL